MRPSDILLAMNVISRLPALYVAHGGGPLPVLGDPGHKGLSTALQRIPLQINATKPTAILVVSAHWEESIPTVTSAQNPELVYDYYGFPPESYSLKYPAPGSPPLAAKVASLLQNAGFECRQDPKRGLDHGAFIPLMLSYPDADIPVVQLSLMSSLDPGQHIKMGEALAPLRSEGVLLYGSGLSFHNMRVFMGAMGGFGGGKADPKSIEFDNYLKSVVDEKSDRSWEERKKMLVEWEKAPHARYCHPREEHLIPMMVAFGAAKGETGRVLYSDPLLGAQASSFAFGNRNGIKSDEGAAPQDEL